MNALRHPSSTLHRTSSCSRQSTPSRALQRHAVQAQTPCRHHQGISRSRLQIVAGERQSSNVTTKRRLTGGTGLPPIDGNDDGGGGGGDGWGWERTARNVLPNLVFLGMYFAVTSYGGDGWGGGFFGNGGGGGGGGGGGANQPDGSGGSGLREEAAADQAAAGDDDTSSGEDSDNSAPVYYSSYNSRREYR